MKSLGTFKTLALNFDHFGALEDFDDITLANSIVSPIKRETYDNEDICIACIDTANQTVIKPERGMFSYDVATDCNTLVVLLSQDEADMMVTTDSFPLFVKFEVLNGKLYFNNFLSTRIFLPEIKPYFSDSLDLVSFSVDCCNKASHSITMTTSEFKDMKKAKSEFASDEYDGHNCLILTSQGVITFLAPKSQQYRKPKLYRFAGTQIIAMENADGTSLIYSNYNFPLIEDGSLPDVDLIELNSVEVPMLFNKKEKKWKGVIGQKVTDALVVRVEDGQIMHINLCVGDKLIYINGEEVVITNDCAYRRFFWYNNEVVIKACNKLLYKDNDTYCIR